MEIVVKVELDKEQFQKMIDDFKAKNPDFVEVVRCKDCKRRKSGGFGQPNILCWQMHDDDYCSYGERGANGRVY